MLLLKLAASGDDMCIRRYVHKWKPLCTRVPYEPRFLCSRHISGNRCSDIYALLTGNMRGIHPINPSLKLKFCYTIKSTSYNSPSKKLEHREIIQPKTKETGKAWKWPETSLQVHRKNASCFGIVNYLFDGL